MNTDEQLPTLTTTNQGNFTVCGCKHEHEHTSALFSMLGLNFRVAESAIHKGALNYCCVYQRLITYNDIAPRQKCYLWINRILQNTTKFLGTHKKSDIFVFTARFSFLSDFMVCGFLSSFCYF